MQLDQYYGGIHTKRLYLRPLTLADVPSWEEFYHNNSNLKYLNIDLNRTPRQMSTAWIDAQIERYRQQAFGQLGIILKETQELVGTTGFLINNYCKQGEIIKATAIKPLYWRKGIGLETAAVLFKVIYENDYASLISGIRHEKNIFSARFAKAQKGVDVAIIQEPIRTVIKYQITKSRWLEYQEYFNSKI